MCITVAAAGLSKRGSSFSAYIIYVNSALCSFSRKCSVTLSYQLAVFSSDLTSVLSWPAEQRCLNGHAPLCYECRTWAPLNKRSYFHTHTHLSGVCVCVCVCESSFENWYDDVGQKWAPPLWKTSSRQPTTGVCVCGCICVCVQNHIAAHWPTARL